MRALKQVDEPALGARVTIDIGLSVLNRPVTGQLLNITQAAAGFEDEPCGVGDERAAARMRCAALEPELAIESGKPVHDAAWSQCPTTLGLDYWSAPAILFLKLPQWEYQIAM